jgi:RNA polymerase sigma factor (sigma-70 family)
MKDFYTHTSATFTTSDGQTLSYQELFDAIKTSVEVYGKRGGRMFSKEDLEDLFQDSIVKALTYIGSYDSRRSQLKTWASRLTANCARDAFRRIMKHRSMFESYDSQYKDDEDYVDPEIAGYRGDEFEADRDLLYEETENQLENAKSSLNDNYQYILELKSEELKPKQMAKVIGCTPGAASTLLCRSRKALAGKLGSAFMAEYGIAS